VLLWLVDNERILAPGAFIRVEMHFMLTLFDRLNVSTKESGRILDTIGKCMHLKIRDLIQGRRVYFILFDTHTFRENILKLGKIRFNFKENFGKNPKQIDSKIIKILN
jgi:hypothetical protein